MNTRINLVRSPASSLEGVLRTAVADSECFYLAVAVAYVSTYGAHYLAELANQTQIKQVRLITDIRDRVTHPQALRIALDEDWNVRVVERQSTFHPKVYVICSGFKADGGLNKPHTYVIGSSNLSKNGLSRNVECNVIRGVAGAPTVIGNTFRTLWSMGRNLNDAMVDEYELAFAERNRERSSTDMSALGVSDEPPGETASLQKTKPATERTGPAIRPAAAIAAWTGLESFTGEYRFQIEFPRDAGSVLNRIVRPHQAAEQVSVRCEDGSVREMTYRFYNDNSMFRLNVPNDVPGVQLARQRHTGIALVEAISDDEASVRLRIIHDAGKIHETIAQSVALGTWDKTTTRLYGWY